MYLQLIAMLWKVLAMMMVKASSIIIQMCNWINTCRDMKKEQFRVRLIGLLSHNSPITGLQWFVFYNSQCTCTISVNVTCT